MDNKGLKMVLTFVAIILFAIINGVILFSGLHIMDYDNGSAIIIIQVIALISIMVISYMVISKDSFPIGFKVPIIMVTVIYALLMDVMCFCLYKASLTSLLVVQLLFLLVYYIIVVPMIYKGICNKKTEE